MRKFVTSTISLLFLFVYGMVVLHNTIPHHHSDNQSTEHHHHHAHESDHGHEHHADHIDYDEHNSDNSEFPRDLSHPFTGQGHLEQITFNQTPFALEFNETIIAPVQEYVNTLYSTSFDQLLLSHKIERPPILYEPPQSSSDPLRGPPYIV